MHLLGVLLVGAYSCTDLVLVLQKRVSSINPALGLLLKKFIVRDDTLGVVQVAFELAILIPQNHQPSETSPRVPGTNIFDQR